MSALAEHVEFVPLGVNSDADTLLFGGAILALASATARTD